jgi:hypothetical protein
MSLYPKIGWPYNDFKMLLLFSPGNAKTSDLRIYSNSPFIRYVSYILFPLSSCYMSAPHSNIDFIFGVIKKVAGEENKKATAETT